MTVRIPPGSSNPALLLLAACCWLLPAALSAAGNLPEPDALELAAAERRHPGAPYIVTGSEQRADLSFDERTGYLNGTVEYEQEVWLRSGDALTRWSRVVVGVSPRRRLDELEVSVRRRDAGKPERYDEGDLKWVASTQVSRGVVTLDGEVRTASIPGLRIGDRLRIRQRYEVSGLHGLPYQVFGGGWAPVLHEAYLLELPADHEMTVTAAGPDSLRPRIRFERTVHGGKQEIVWRTGEWTGERDESVRVQPHLRRIGGREPEGAFCVGASWAVTGAHYRETIEPVLEVTPAIRAQAVELVAGAATRRDSLQNVYDWVQKTTRYLGMFEEMGGIIPVPASEVLELHYGDCKGLGTLLIALLRAVGFDAYPALVRVGAPGSLVEEEPNLIQFNHYIAWVDDGAKGLWLDGTVDGFPVGFVPPADAASPVLLLAPGREGLRSIPRAAWSPGVIEVLLEGTIDEDRKLHCSAGLTATGISAVRRQVLVRRSKPARREELLRDALLPATLGMRVLDWSTGERAVPDSTYWSLACVTSGPLPGGPDQLFLPARLLDWPAEMTQEHSERCPEYRETWRIDLPAGMSVTPDSVAVERPGLKWFRTTRAAGGRLQVEQAVAVDAAACEGIDADAMRDFQREVREHQNQYLILRRSSGP